jgi:gephyrin
MIDVDQALATILTETELTADIEEVHFLDALGRVCAENVTANDPLPPFAASIKDGFAVRFTDEQRDALASLSSTTVRFEFKVIGASNAGDGALNADLNGGECVKINTGAPVPLKADAVVQIEDTVSLAKDEASGRDTRIEVVRTSGCGGGGGSSSALNLKLGQEIRPIGSDIAVGECVVSERTVIGAAQIGICATVGTLRLKCFKRPTVGLVSTGNELVKPDEAVASPGKIRDSNKSLLHAALRSHGVADIHDAGIASDEPNSVLQVFKGALENSDVVISTGGVSMGDKVNFFA